MFRLRLIAVATLLVVSSICVAGDATAPAGHSTVHLIFQSKYSPQGLSNATSVPLVQVGGMVVPETTVRPIEIQIDGEFVGHAMIGSSELKPVFVLPEGKHEFVFTVGDDEPIRAKLKVLGTGSTQFLLVKLPMDEEPKESPAKSQANARSEPVEAVSKPMEKYMTYAQRIVQRYDKNGDDELTASEWQPMLMSPVAADANKDGSITIDEYAAWMQSRKKDN